MRASCPMTAPFRVRGRTLSYGGGYVVRRGPRAVHPPVCARARETIRTIRSTRRDTCHLACTRDAVDACCHVSADSLAVSETAGAEACIKGSMKTDLGGLARGVFNALLAPPRRGSLLRLPRHFDRLPTKEVSTFLGIVLSLECERYLP